MFHHGPANDPRETPWEIMPRPSEHDQEPVQPDEPDTPVPSWVLYRLLTQIVPAAAAASSEPAASAQDEPASPAASWELAPTSPAAASEAATADDAVSAPMVTQSDPSRGASSSESRGTMWRQNRDFE